MRKALSPKKCPSCSNPLVVTQLTCTYCGTSVVGNYELSPFVKLSRESLQFLETFVRNRGNVKEMAREVDESYWVIRRKLDKVIEEMELDAEDADKTNLSNRRQAVLERLSNGEINVEEAKKMLLELEG